MKKYLSAIAGWKGWKKIFPLPVWAETLLFIACGAGLVWIFIHGFEMWWPSYILYGLSAYCLTALCIHIPAAIRREGNWRQQHPKVDAFLKNGELHFKLELYAEQFINFAYGIFKIITGVIVGSAWIGADGIYNFTQALIQLFQILRRKKPGNQIITGDKSWRITRLNILIPQSGSKRWRKFGKPTCRKRRMN